MMGFGLGFGMGGGVEAAVAAHNSNCCVVGGEGANIANVCEDRETNDHPRNCEKVVVKRVNR